MSTTYAVVTSLGICVIVAALEGVCAGKNVKTYFATLRWPPYSPPLWIWYIIGGLYYATFFFVVYRVLRLDTSTALKPATLALILFMMVANALWNYLFFRAQNLFFSFIGSSLAPIFDVSLLVLLTQLDRVAAWSLAPYLLYRIYAVWWGYSLWKVNSLDEKPHNSS